MKRRTSEEYRACCFQAASPTQKEAGLVVVSFRFEVENERVIRNCSRDLLEIESGKNRVKVINLY